MEDRFIDKHRFRLCVEIARKHILEKDDFSLEARSLLTQLIYVHISIDKINFNKLNWETIKINNCDWVEHYNMTETRFNNIKEFLVDKIIK